MRKKGLPILTVIIGTFNRLKLFKKCLQAIEESTRTPHDIFVLDAGSTDGTKEFIRKRYKHIHLHADKKRLGQAKSFNALLPAIHSKYVCWLSDDNILQPQVLDQAIDILEDDDDIGMVGLKVKDVRGPFRYDPYIGGIWPSGVLNVNQGMIRTQILRKVKYFDVKFPDYGMDADLTTKVLMRGYKVVLTKVIAIYHMRDYKNYPGVFKKQERNVNLQLALYLYKNKYKKLCYRYMRKRMLYLESISTLFRILLSHLFSFQRFGFSLEKITGYKRRDFVNVFEAGIRI